MRSRFVAVSALALCTQMRSPAPADPQAPAPSPTPIVLPTLPPDRPLNPYVKMGIDLVTGLLSRNATADPNVALGEISYFKRFEMQLRVGPDAYRSVHLHRGTVINPLGLTLAPGMRVRVRGIGQSNGSLNADAITVER